MILNGKVICNQNLKKHSKSTFRLASVYILSAVRTPIGLRNGVLNEFSAPQLASFTFREALQRALVPCKDFQNVFLGGVLHTDCISEIINRTGLSKTAKVSFASRFGMKSFVESIKYLTTGNKMVCIAGGIDSTSNQSPDMEYSVHFESMLENMRIALKNNSDYKELMKLVEQDHKKFSESNKNGAFLDEIIRINFVKKGQQIIVEEDEMANLHFFTGENSEYKYSQPLADGAVAVVLSTEDYIRNKYLTPLAKVVSFAEEPATGSNFASIQRLAIEKALKVGNCQYDEISRWEMDSACDFVFSWINHVKFDPSLLNKDGGLFCCGYPIGMSGMKAVCHLIHSLSDGELGCAVTCDFKGSACAVIVKKLRKSSSGKPQLTLYTKHICPLCDELKEGLKAFGGRFSLKEIDIEAEGNENYKDLFKYDIPVLFLDGRFLCKHKLDVQCLSRRLASYENVIN